MSGELSLSARIRACQTLTELDHLIHAVCESGAPGLNGDHPVVIHTGKKMSPLFAVTFKFLSTTRYQFYSAHSPNCHPIPEFAAWVERIERAAARGAPEVNPDAQ